MSRHKRLSFPGQSTIVNERALTKFASSVTSASQSGSVVEQSYQCSLFSSHFATFWISLVKLWARKWKENQTLKSGNNNNNHNNNSSGGGGGGGSGGTL
jgi:hypothetical protein